MAKIKYDFSGYATRYEIKCTDGRTISANAFKHMDGVKIPLYWSHKHGDVEAVLGHAYLEHRDDDGVYAYAVFNETEKGKAGKIMVKHGDIEGLSIYANHLREENQNVKHGMIQEMSLVMSKANPGAGIDYVEMMHGDDVVISKTDAIIHFDISDTEWDNKPGETELKHADDGDETVADIFNAMSDKEQNVVYAMVAAAQKNGSMKQSDGDDEDEDLTHQNAKGDKMKKRVFDTKDPKNNQSKSVLKHSDVEAIFNRGRQMGSLKHGAAAYLNENADLKKAFEEFKSSYGPINHEDAVDYSAFLTHESGFEEGDIMHATNYGIENVGILFPDAKAVTKTPELDTRRMHWVNTLLGKTKKLPFAKFKSDHATLTEDEARAKGYITGNEKFETFFAVFTRTTEPTTVYRKQKMDKDIIDDITDFDVMMWLKSQQKVFLREEIARAILVGDGRVVTDPDKIKEANIRPIYTDDDKYCLKYQMASDATGLDELEQIQNALDDYKGSGQIDLYTTRKQITAWRQLKNGQNDYRFKSKQEIADHLDVNSLVDVDILTGIHRTFEAKEYDLVCIMVDMHDYSTGTNKGGKMSMFEDFDIDFNQFKTLLETRMSGALTKLYSAVVVEKEQPAG